MSIKDIMETNKNQNKDNSHSNKIYKKKLSSGFELPVLGIGTYTFGGEHETDYSNDKEWISAIKTALDLGYTHIDTAEIYGSGHTEELVGKAIEGYEREKLFITTKVYKTNLRYDDVLKSAQESLRRMKINYIDLHLIHSFNPDIPLKETILAMNELVKKGLVRYIGVCNFSISQLKEAQKHSKVKIINNQMKYKIWSETKPDIKKPNIKTFEYCQKNNIMITAYKIFGRSKIKTDKIPLISEIAKKYNKNDAQVIINWIASKKNFVMIFMSMNKNHLKENIDALKFTIDKQDIQKLDDSFLK
ncbi:MAG: aldo/keto reductase [archaeon]